MTEKEYVDYLDVLTNDDLIEELKYCGHDSYYNDMYYSILDEIKKRMSAKEKRKTGKWITHDYAFGIERYECDICENRCGFEYSFCPNCGADMRGDR